MSIFTMMLVLAIALLWPLTGTAAAAERVALVIGNGAYTRVTALASPENDADLMTTALQEVGFDVVGGVDLNKEQMETAIIDFGRRLREAGPDAEGLFYYSGHGVQSQGINYLIPLHAPIEEESHLNIKAVPAWWVLQQMENARNRLNLVLLDACRNNPFRRHGKNIGGEGGLRGVVEAPKGTLIVYAAAPGKVAYDGGNSPYSPFTEALVETMALPGVQIETALKQVRIAVDDRTGGRQEPWSTSSLVGDFCFRPPCSDRSPTALRPSPEPQPVEAAPATVELAPAAPGTCDCYDDESCLWCKVRDNCARLDQYRREYSDDGRHIQAYWKRKSECAAERATDSSVR